MSSDYLYGYNMNGEGWKKDGLKAAFGARTIQLGFGMPNGKLDIVPNRKSLISEDELSESALKTLINDYGAFQKVIDWYAKNYRDLEDYEVYSVWGKDSALQADVRCAGGYCYIRIGIKQPMELGSFKDYDKYKEAGKPEDDSVCFLDVPIPVGTKVEVRSRGEWVTGTVLTYTKLGGFDYGIVLRDEMPDTWDDPWTMMPNFMNNREVKVISEKENVAQ